MMMTSTLGWILAVAALVVFCVAMVWGLSELRGLTQKELKLAELRKLREVEVEEGRIIDYQLLDWLPEAEELEHVNFDAPPNDDWIQKLARRREA